MKKRHKKAFSLIELSIIILIISIIAAGSLTVSKTIVNNAKIATTKAKMDTIYKALTAFIATNRRLPCPALLWVQKGHTKTGFSTINSPYSGVYTFGYGQEFGNVAGINGNNCSGIGPLTVGNVYTSSFPASFYSNYVSDNPTDNSTNVRSSADPVAEAAILASVQASNSAAAFNLAYGMVPVATLGLDPDFAEDAWGTKIDYVVDTRFTTTSVDIMTGGELGFETTQGSPSQLNIVLYNGYGLNGMGLGSGNDLESMDIQGPATNSLLPYFNGILLLISHGANKYGGFDAASTTQNPQSTIADEKLNSCGNPCKATLPSPGATTNPVNGNASTIGAPTPNSDTAFTRSFIVSSSSSGFDDILLYKTKPQLLKDAGLEFAMCDIVESAWNDGSGHRVSFNKTGGYGCSICTSTGNGNGTGGGKQETCGRYGTWGPYDLPYCGNYTLAGTKYTTGSSSVLSCSNTGSFLQVYSNTAQTLPNTTSSAVTFNQYLPSNGSSNFPFTTGTATSNFTPPIAGYWLISYGINFQNAASYEKGMVAAWIEMNGNTNLRYGEVSMAYDQFASEPTRISSSAVVYFNGSTDYFSIYAWQGSGSNSSLGAAGAFASKSSSVSMTYLHPSYY